MTVLELSQTFLVMSFVPEQFQSMLHSLILGQRSFLTRNQRWNRNFTYIVSSLDKILVSVIQNEKSPMCELIFGGWKLGHRIDSCFAKKSALNRFALLSPSFGKSLRPRLSSLGSLFSIQFWQTMNDLHIEDKSQHKGKYCWYI